MPATTTSWKKLFLFCTGLALAASFCMKWLEPSFQVQGQSFGIIGLELFYPKEKVMNILAGLDTHTKALLRYHLYFDFMFMAGIFPAIASLCMLARERLQHKNVRRFLFILATLQTLAWALDITENSFLLNWIDKPVIDSQFSLFHLVVSAKWIIAILGVITALTVLLLRRKPERLIARV